MEGLRPLQTTPEIVDYQTISVAQLVLTSISIDKKGLLQSLFCNSPFGLIPFSRTLRPVYLPYTLLKRRFFTMLSNTVLFSRRPTHLVLVWELYTPTSVASPLR